MALGANLIVWATRVKSCMNLCGVLSPVCALSLLLLNPLQAQTRTFGLVVVGLGGDNDYREMFEEAASVTINAVSPSTSSAHPIDSDNNDNNENNNDGKAIAEPASEADNTREGGGLQLLLEHEADRETILEVIAAQVELANQQDEASRFMLMLFGHGNYDGEHYRFNTRGPDVTAAEIQQALQPLKASQQFLMFATSASGAVLDIFAQNDKDQQGSEAANHYSQRIVVTATKSGAEANAVQFPRYWSEVLAGQLADTDHNELLTVMEAYDAASQGVARHYDKRQLLATEHSRLMSDDESSIVLARLGSLRGQENNSEVNRLLDQREQLEIEFNQVRETRDSKAESDYLDELEQVLLEIARLQLRIDEATGWQPDEINESGQASGGQKGG